MLLGTVPVEADGSAYFRVPAGKPLLFQAVDGEGRAVQGMRSLAYFQPGERRSCFGCHEPREVVPEARSPLATRRGPSTIEPGPDGSRPWSFQRLVQPVIRERCDRCHDGNVAKPDLAALPEEEFTRAYRNLRPYVRWYEWGGDSIDGVTTRPGRMPADESPLVEILKDSHHADIGLEDEEIRRLYLWLDGNAAFYGVYDDDGRVAQLRGETVAEPEVQ
jgi:hypothetical protein